RGPQQQGDDHRGCAHGFLRYISSATGIPEANTAAAKTMPESASWLIPLITWPLVHPPARRAPNSSSAPAAKETRKRTAFRPPNRCRQLLGSSSTLRERWSSAPSNPPPITPITTSSSGDRAAPKLRR